MGGSANDNGISETFFPEQAVDDRRGDADSAPTPCPPQSPTIFVNPHEHRIIDTLHRDLIRVNILGTSGFNVKEINPSTVTLDGVHCHRPHHAEGSARPVPDGHLRLRGQPVASAQGPEQCHPRRHPE